MALGKLSRAKLPKEAKLFVLQTRLFLSKLDLEMTQKESAERGKRVSSLANELEMAVDLFEHFGIKGWPVVQSRK